MAKNRENSLSTPHFTAETPNPNFGLRPRLHRQAIAGLVLLGLALPWGVRAQAPPPPPIPQAPPTAQSAQPPQTPGSPFLQHPAGADKGVVLSILPENNLLIQPPAGAIYKFGTTDRFLHPVLNHTFTLRNDGKAPVVIDHIQATCGCTSALLVANGKEATGYTLLPGKQIGIKTTIDMTKLQAGPIKKFLWVMMPGETNPTFIIRLDADIEGVLTFDPPAVEFGRMQAGETPAKQLDVTLDKRLLDAVGGVKLVSSNPGIKVTLAAPTDSPIPGGDGHSVMRTYLIAVTPKATLGVLSGTLSFVPLKSAVAANKTNTKAAAETATTFLASLTANITGELFGKVTARPGTIVFGPVTEGDTTVRHITLVGKTEESLQNLKVSSPSLWVTAKVRVPERPKQDPTAPPLKLPPMMLLEVTLNPKAPPGALQTQLTLTTQDGEQLVLPAFGYVTPAVKH